MPASHHLFHAMHDDIAHRMMLASAPREAGIDDDLIVEVLPVNAPAQSDSGARDNNRITDARRLMAATLRQREISDLPNQPGFETER